MSKKFLPSLKNQKGSILVIALLMLIILTVIGFSALNTSTIEIKITSNEVNRNVAFYQADSGISHVLANPPSDPIVNATVIDNSSYKVVITQILKTDIPKQIEVQSDSKSSYGSASILAGIQLPQQQGGQGGSGYEGQY